MKRSLAPLCLSLLVGLPLAASLPGGSIIVAILGISFLIFVHEWGHFYACKLTGTRTETFSIGFGPRLFGWEKTRDGGRRFTIGRRQTDPADHAMDFRVAAIPLGGYVKMAGELPGEGMGDAGEPAADEFPGKSPWARIFIVCAGVIMNFITAFVFYAICIGFNKPFDPPLVGAVQSGSAAWHAGLQTGDRIQDIDGHRVPTFTDLRVAVALGSGSRDSDIAFERDGADQTGSFRPIYDEENGLLRFGVGAAHGLELGEGEGAFEIGATEAVTINGVPARGGAEALELVVRATLGGFLPIEATKPDGTTFTLNTQPGESAVEAPTPRVGIAEFAELHVSAVRGQAEGKLEKGDIVVSAHAAGVVRPMDSKFAWTSLVFQAPVTNITIRRGAETRAIAVELPDPAAVRAFLADMAIDPKVQDGRFTMIEAGSTQDIEGEVWRYPSAPAIDAGMPRGAKITKVNGLVVSTIPEISKELKAVEPGKPVRFRIQVGDAPEKDIEITPVALERLGALAVRPVEYKERWSPDGFGQTLAWGFDRTVRETMNVFRTIKVLFTGDLSFNKNIAGPITLISASKTFAEEGWTRLLWFLAYVSVMLAVLNILPIPVLDGGHLMFIIIEMIRGKPLKDETVYNMQKIGFLLLLVLMFFAFKNDITRLID